MLIALRLLVVLALGTAGLAASTAAVAPQVADFFTAGELEAPEIDLAPLPERSIAYADDGSVLATFHAEENREEVELDDIPDEVVQAILAVEDEDFYSHNGFNLRSTIRALFENVSAGGIEQGGSTITQQLVKLSLLTPEQDLNRKAREAILAIQLEHEMSKDEILERYLNAVYFGGGAYGVQAAAELYWGLDVGELDWGKGALLASLIANPVGYDPTRDPETALERRALALQRLIEVGHLTEEEAALYALEPLPTARQQVLPEPNDYFVEEVKQQLLDMEELGETQAERFNAVFKGGLRIQTTFNPAAQYLALNAVGQELPDTGGQFTAALASMDPSTGAVRAMVGGPGFDQYKYNLVTQGERQPGSSFKIFVLVTALKNGFTPGDVVNGQGPCQFPNPGGSPDPYVAENFGGSAGSRGSITSLTTSSSNCGFLRLGQLVGLDNVVETARQMGVTSELDPRVLSLPLGAEEVSPLDMATAAATLANGGVRHRPYFIETVTDDEGNVIYQRQDEGRRVMSEQVACLATQVLEANVTGGTGTAARLSNMPSAGKTGTAQNFEDAWFVGYTPYLATSVWMGNAASKVPMLGVGGRNVTGGSFPAAIWGAYNQPAHQVSSYRPFPACQPTRPPNDLTRFFDPEPAIPDFSDLVNQAPVPPPTVVTLTCPDGFVGQDNNGDGQIDTCIQNAPPPPPPPPTDPPPPTVTATIP